MSRDNGPVVGHSLQYRRKLRRFRSSPSYPLSSGGITLVISSMNGHKASPMTREKRKSRLPLLYSERASSRGIRG